MSYSKEAISDSTPAVPTNAAPIMREEAVYDPYAVKVKTPLGQPVGQPDTSSGAKPEETKAPEETVKLSPAMAALARKEQKSRLLEKSLKEREAALEAKATKIAKLEAMEAKLAQKDYSALDDLVDYNEYSQYQVNKLNSNDPNAQALKKLESEVDGIKKAHQDNVTKQFEAAVSERRLAVKQLVETSADKFPGITKLKQQEAVVQHILDTWENDSEELSVEQAAKEVEDILEERAKHWASVLEIKKPEDMAPKEGEKKPLPAMKQGLKTITNQVTTGDIKRPVKSFQHMSDSERWAEARRRAEEKLQQSKG